MRVTRENIAEALGVSARVKLTPPQIVARLVAAGLCRTLFGRTFFALQVERLGRPWFAVGALEPEPYGGSGPTWRAAIEEARATLRQLRGGAEPGANLDAPPPLPGPEED